MKKYFLLDFNSPKKILLKFFLIKETALNKKTIIYYRKFYN